MQIRGGEVAGNLAEVSTAKRLKVEAEIIGQGGSPVFTLQPFTPKVHFDAVGVTLNTSTYTDLHTVSSGDGKLDFIASSAGSSNYKIRVTVDGAIIFDIAMSELSAIGLSNAVNVEMWAETADKNFRYHPNMPVDFTSGFKVEAIATSAGTIVLKHLIMYREAAT